jgi:hypothetical protein
MTEKFIKNPADVETLSKTFVAVRDGRAFAPTSVAPGVAAIQAVVNEIANTNSNVAVSNVTLTNVTIGGPSINYNNTNHVFSIGIGLSGSVTSTFNMEVDDTRTFSITDANTVNTFEYGLIPLAGVTLYCKNNSVTTANAIYASFANVTLSNLALILGNASGNVDTNQEFHFDMANNESNAMFYRNAEAYHTWLDVASDLGRTWAGDAVFRYNDFFGSFTLTNAVVDVMTERLERIQTGEIYPGDPIWETVIYEEIKDVAGMIATLAGQNEASNFDMLISELKDTTDAATLLNFMNTGHGLYSIRTAATGDVKELAVERYQATLDKLGSDLPDEDGNTPISDDDTPFYEIINDRTP